MSPAHEVEKLQVVTAQFRQHASWRYFTGIAVLEALPAGDLSNRSNGPAADLSDPPGDQIGHSDQLIGLLVQHQMVVPKVSPPHVPMKALRLQIQSENIREQTRKGAADLVRDAWSNIGPDGDDGGRLLAFHSSAHRDSPF